MKMEMKKMMIEIVKMMLEKAYLEKSDEFEKDDEDEIKVNNIELSMPYGYCDDPCGYDDNYIVLCIKYKGKKIFESSRLSHNQHRLCPIQECETCGDEECEYENCEINEKYLKNVYKELDEFVNENWDNLVKEKTEKDNELTKMINKRKEEEEKYYNEMLEEVKKILNENKDKLNKDEKLIIIDEFLNKMY